MELLTDGEMRRVGTHKPELSIFPNRPASELTPFRCEHTSCTDCLYNAVNIWSFGNTP